jgi:hypothetical protein
MAETFRLSGRRGDSRCRCPAVRPAGPRRGRRGRGPFALGDFGQKPISRESIRIPVKGEIEVAQPVPFLLAFLAFIFNLCVDRLQPLDFVFLNTIQGGRAGVQGDDRIMAGPSPAPPCQQPEFTSFRLPWRPCGCAPDSPRRCIRERRP